MSNKEFYIPSLDGLRCVAIMLVFGGHVSLACRLPNFIPGSLGVTIFFFLSGLLITTLLRVEQDKTGKIDIKRFYLRRVLRIFPPFYIVLAIAVICGLHPALHTDKELMEGRYVLGQVFHLSNYQIAWKGDFDVPIAPGTEVFWSLAVEEHFYLFFPWVFIWLLKLRNRRAQAMALLGGCGAILLWRLVLHFVAGASEHHLYVATDTRADSILFGCALALWGNPALDGTRIKESTWKWILFPLGILGLLLSLVIQAPWFEATVRYSLQGISLFPIYITAVRYPTWGVMKWLNLSAVRWIGILSYSIYLFHPTALRFGMMMVGSSRLLLGLIAFALTLAVAAALHFWVERPMARLRKKFSVTAQHQPPEQAVLDAKERAPA